MFLNNKPEHTNFTKLYEDKSESLRVEVSGVSHNLYIYQNDESNPITLTGEEAEWLISILKDSLRLIEYE